MTEEESDKKVSGGTGITAAGDVSVSTGSGQVAIGENRQCPKFHDHP